LDERIVLMTGDLGYMALEPFRERYPHRFFNMGVAEQNMIGVATGLAESGFIPYAYSIATFASLRALEFIRNGPILHHLPVRVVGMGMGFEYGVSGWTHYAVEDIGVLRALPGLAIVIPADSAQTTAAIRDTYRIPGPVYYSLGKDDRVTVPGLEGRFEMGKVQVIRGGGELGLVSMGSLSQEVAYAAEELSAHGVEATVAIVSDFSQDSMTHLAEILLRLRQVITVEAQTLSGGLGACVASVIASCGLPCRLRPLGVGEASDGTSGNQADRWRKYGLDRSSIVSTALQTVRGFGAATHP
jgi:transketolase